MSVISLYSSDYRARFYLRQISKLAKIPLKTCQTTLLNLEKERIVKSKIEGKNKYFGLNLENIQTKSNLLKAEIYKTDNFLEKYPELVDEGLKQIHNRGIETPMVDTVTGEVVSGGNSNGWNYSLTQTVNILPGWEREYAAVLKRLRGVERVEFIPMPLP